MKPKTYFFRSLCSTIICYSMDYNFVFAVLTLLLLVLFEEVITISKIVLFDVTQLVSSIKF